MRWLREAPGAALPGPLPLPEPIDAVTIPVTNTSAVPISVTPHFHFFEANPRLSFDRAAAYGRRIAIGFAGLIDCPLDAPGALEEALRRARECGHQGAGPDE